MPVNWHGNITQVQLFHAEFCVNYLNNEIKVIYYSAEDARHFLARVENQQIW